MNNQGKYNDDILRQYINSERIEKAPEGFTSKVMTRIQIGKVPLRAADMPQKKNLVPVISAAVIILLLVTAFFIPCKEVDPLAYPVATLFNNIKASLPELNLSSIFRLNLPSVIMYVFAGILILTLFDRALYGIFHREK
jgi:hypothetical protein